MRVISGSARGRRLLELSGRDTRPTTDKVKESIFNILQFDIQGRRVLDLFAGTGQLGIEALSRGAQAAVFVDHSPKAAGLVRQNLERTGLAQHASVVQSDWRAFLSACRGEKFQLIFLDPPYATGTLQAAMETIAAVDILSEHGIMVCESPAEEPLPDCLPGLRRGRDYRYGKIQVTLYHGNGVCPP